MSAQNKQKIPQKLINSASSLPVFSPKADQDTPLTLDFSESPNPFLIRDPADKKKQDQDHKTENISLRLIDVQKIAPQKNQFVDFNEIPCLQQKRQKQSCEKSSNLYLPLTTKEKLSEAYEAFEVPQLTAQSLLESQQIDLDNESNGNELLLSSKNYKIERMFHQQSEGSDEMASFEDKKRKLKIKQYAESKGSDRSQSDDLPAICKPCFSLMEKCKLLQVQNGNLTKQILLKDEIIKNKQTQMEQKQGLQTKHFSILPPKGIKQNFLLLIEELSRIMPKINQLILSYEIDFVENECHYLQAFSIQFKKIDQNVLGRYAKEERKLQVDQIHKNYKKIILNIMKNCEEKQQKKQQDFKKFVNSLIKKQLLQNEARATYQMKSDRNRKKSKTYAQKEENTELDYIQQIKSNEQNKQKIQWLELNFNREKEKCRYLNKNQQKYISQINDLMKEKNFYKNQAAKYSKQFSAFMIKMAQTQSKCLIQTDFFKAISLRVFQISNCIPFEDNDEQNLFAPQNQEQLFDMIERIRRFYMKIETYNLKRQSDYQSQKNIFILFLKELIEENKVSSKYIVEHMLEDKKYHKLNYLKELIYNLKHLIKDHIPQRQSYQNKKLLKIQRTKSFTFISAQFDKET